LLSTLTIDHEHGNSGLEFLDNTPAPPGVGGAVVSVVIAIYQKNTKKYKTEL